MIKTPELKNGTTSWQFRGYIDERNPMITIDLIGQVTTAHNVISQWSTLQRATLTIPTRHIDIRKVWESDDAHITIYELDQIILGLRGKIATMTITTYGPSSDLELSIIDDDYSYEVLLDGWQKYDDHNYRHVLGATFWTEKSIDV